MRLKHTLIFIWQASKMMIAIKILDLAKMIAPKDSIINIAISEAIIKSCDYVIDKECITMTKEIVAEAVAFLADLCDRVEESRKILEEF